MVGLGDLPGGVFYSEALATSADGSIIVGQSVPASSSGRAFIWDEVNGMRDFKEVLTDDFGLNLTGWEL